MNLATYFTTTPPPPHPLRNGYSPRVAITNIFKNISYRNLSYPIQFREFENYIYEVGGNRNVPYILPSFYSTLSKGYPILSFKLDKIKHMKRRSGENNLI